MVKIADTPYGTFPVPIVEGGGGVPVAQAPGTRDVLVDNSDPDLTLIVGGVPVVLYTVGVNSLIIYPQVAYHAYADTISEEHELTMFALLADGDTLEWDFLNSGAVGGPTVSVNPATLFIINADGSSSLARSGGIDTPIAPTDALPIDFSVDNGVVGAALTWDAVNKQVVVHAAGMYYFRVTAPVIQDSL